MPLSAQTATNQPPLQVDYNLLATDIALTEGIKREGADWHLPALTQVCRLFLCRAGDPTTAKIRC